MKVVCATSPQLFAMQGESYRKQVLSDADKMDSTVVTTQARWLMHDWLFNKVGEEYALSSDWDDRWRTGGSVDEVLEEAHLSPKWLVEGITRFVRDRGKRLARLSGGVAAAVGAAGRAAKAPAPRKAATRAAGPRKAAAKKAPKRAAAARAATKKTPARKAGAAKKPARKRR